MRQAKKIVIDASVVAKWFLEEVYSTNALLLRDARLVTAGEELVTKAKDLIALQHLKDLT